MIKKMIILKFSNNSKNTSYIYTNIVTVNSSKILLGNEFNLNYKSSYGKQYIKSFLIYLI